MPLRGRFRGTRTGSRQSRRMEWKGAGSASEAAAAVGSLTSFFVVLPSEARAMTSPTLIRSQISMCIFKPTSGSIRGAWGLITWDDIDDTAPVGAELPGPFTRPDLSWIAHGYIFSSAISGAGAVGFSSQLGPGTLVDVKSMRRLPDPRGILLVVENHSTSTVSFSWMAGVRCLLKE